MKKIIILAFLASVLFCLPAGAEECGSKEVYEKAMGLIEQAGSAADFAQKKNLLQESIGLCECFSNHYQLGRVLFEQAHAEMSDDLVRQAVKEFEAAFCWSCNDKEEALALNELGKAALTQEENHKAVYYFKMSYERFPDEIVKERLMETQALIARTGSKVSDVRQTLGAEIACQAKPACKQKGAFTPRPLAKPSLDMHIHFEFNSWALDATGRQEARVLADALRDSSFSGKRVLLVGHTDVRGDDSYNLTLSRKRADAVRSFILYEQNVSGVDILTDGRGEGELISSGQSEQDHALNRRVEVKIN